MDGVTVGLLLGAVFATLFLVGRYKKENISAKFLSEECTGKNYIYVYWSRNNPASKRPVPIFIDGEFVGSCKKSKISKFKHPKQAFKITSLVPHNQSVVSIDEKGPIYILVNHLGKCERFFIEEESNG